MRYSFYAKNRIFSMFNKTFTIVDVETTGGKPDFNRVIEIGILRIEKGEVVSKYKSFINPEIPVPEFITEFTGISDRQVKKAPKFCEIAEEVLALFEDSIFVAHNSSFDYGFLKHEFRRVGLEFNMQNLCTVRLSRVLFPQYKKHNLSAIIERFNFKCKKRHRAYDEAKVLWDFLQRLQKDFTPEILEKVVTRTIQGISPKLQKKLIMENNKELLYEPYNF